MKPYPKNFMWGSSTAAHQVEGGTHNQWTAWELAHASEQAKTAKQRLAYLNNLGGHAPVATEMIDKASRPANYVSGKGTDHYRLYETDFDILKKLNQNAFRFSIEWSRVEPQEGIWDEAGIEHYRSYIKALKKRGIEPIVTLWHWTVPIWFSDKGEFEKSSNIKYFVRFVAKVIEEYGDDLRWVITLNEPSVHVLLSYLMGTRPPQKKNVVLGLAVARNLVQAHKEAYKVIKKKNIALRVGVAYSLSNIVPKNPHKLRHATAAKVAAYVSNWWFLDRIRRAEDFIGLNYYFTDYKDSRPHINRNPQYPANDLGWYMEPQGIFWVLMQLWDRYKKPIIVTENGLADHNDQWREWWLDQTMHALEKTLTEGVDLRGYLHWSLLDNFEWDYGWWPEFGLVSVDRDHGMKRSIRPSAEWYAKYITEHR